MLNVDRVFTSKWTPLDKVRDYVTEQLDSVLATTTLTSEQKADVRTKLFNALDTSVTDTWTATTPFLDFQDRNGVIIPDTPSCVEIATEAYKDALGDDIDTTTESHVGRLIEQSAIIMRSAIGFTAENVMQMDINAATGRYLDAIGAMFFANRKAKVPTVVTVVVSNNTDTDITALAVSTRFTDANGVIFNLREDTVCAANATTQLAFVCADSGYVTPETPFTWTILSTLENPIVEKMEIGYDVESDDDYRARLKIVRVSSKGFNESVKSALYSIDGVYDAIVLENTTNTNQTIRGVSYVGPHSIAAYVDYDGTTATSDLIAEAIFTHKSIGCGYSESSVGSAYYGSKVTRTVTDPSFGAQYDVTFYAPVLKSVTVAVEVTRNEYTGTDLAGDVKKAIVDWANGNVPYVDGLSLGYDVKSYEIGAAVSQRIPEIQVDSVALKFTSQSGTPSAARLTVNAYERATIAIENITVTVVG